MTSRTVCSCCSLPCSSWRFKEISLSKIVIFISLAPLISHIFSSVSLNLECGHSSCDSLQDSRLNGMRLRQYAHIPLSRFPSVYDPLKRYRQCDRPDQSSVPVQSIRSARGGTDCRG